VGYHGYPRATGGMGIWIAMSEANAEKIMEALDDFGFGGTGMTLSQFALPDQITRMGNRLLQIEILTTISGLDFAAAYARRIVDVIDEVPVFIISTEDLKTNKRASGRLKDLADLDNLP
jgi:hypothetical protein